MSKGAEAYKTELIEKYINLKELEAKNKNSKMASALYRDKQRDIQNVFFKNFKINIDEYLANH